MSKVHLSPEKLVFILGGQSIGQSPKHLLDGLL